VVLTIVLLVVVERELGEPLEVESLGVFVAWEALEVFSSTRRPIVLIMYGGVLDVVHLGADVESIERRTLEAHQVSCKALEYWKWWEAQAKA